MSRLTLLLITLCDLAWLPHISPLLGVLKSYSLALGLPPKQLPALQAEVNISDYSTSSQVVRNSRIMATSAAAGLLGRQLKQMQSDKDIPGISCGLVDNNVMEWEVMLMIDDDCRFYGGTRMILTYFD